MNLVGPRELLTNYVTLFATVGDCGKQRFGGGGRDGGISDLLLS